MSGNNAPVDAAALDTPINRTTIDKLPISTLDAWLADIRVRRLAVVQRLQEAKDAKKRAYINDVLDKYTAQYSKTEKSMQKLDDYIDIVEKHLLKLRALGLELEDNDHDPC